MNNKGQTLVLFVVLLPVILILLAFVFDTAYMSMEKNKLNDIAKTSLKYVVKDNKDINEVKKVIKENDNKIKIEKITNNNVYLKKEIKPIFGQIIGFQKYSLKTNLYGKMEGNKLIIKEKGQ